jgi:hypothetical protein
MKDLYDIKIEYEKKIKELKGIEPGLIRSRKGKLVEDLAEDLLVIACNMLGIDKDRISFGPMDVKVPLENMDYLLTQPYEVSNYLIDNLEKCYHELKTDTNLSIDGQFVLDVECKSYTENTMLKKIVQDCIFIRNAYPKTSVCVLQLENALGGDYGGADVMGSPMAHAIMSHGNVDIKIITLMNGNRSSNRPIHAYPKDIVMNRLVKAVDTFKFLIKRSSRLLNVPIGMRNEKHKSVYVIPVRKLKDSKVAK